MKPSEAIEAQRTMLRDDPRFDPAWFAIGRWAGIAAGVALLVASLLQAAADQGWIGTEPAFRETDAGPLVDVATFYADSFAFEHDVIWSLAIRDTLFPIAFMAIIVVGMAIRRIVGAHRADAQLLATTLLVGGLISLMNPLIYLSVTTWWRETGWSADPPENMVAVGRAAEAIIKLTRYFQTFGALLLAIGLLLLWRVIRSTHILPSGIAFVSLVLGGGLAIAAVASVFDVWWLWDIGTGAFGVILGPLLLVWLGTALWDARSEGGPRPQRFEAGS
jgi:hypothetical protein